MWLKKFWHVVIDKCYQYLKPGGFFIFSLTNYKKYNLIENTMEYIKKYSYKRYPFLKISYHNVYRNREKLENIFIFRKSI